MKATKRRLQKVLNHPLFNDLAEKQQTFTRVFLETGDGRHAIITAGYNSKDDASRESFARKLLKHSIIKQLIALGLGYDPQAGAFSKSELLIEMSKQMRRCKSPAIFSRLSEMYCGLKEWVYSNEVPDVQDVVAAIERAKKEKK